MAFILNTSDPLFNSILSFVMVDSDNVIKDLTGNHALTTDAAVTITSGSLGNSFLTDHLGSNALGVAVSPALIFHDSDKTLLVVTDGIVSSNSRRSVFNAAGTNSISPAILSNGNASTVTGTSNPSFDSGVNISSGAHSEAIVRGVNPDSFEMVVDGVSERLLGKVGSNGNLGPTYIGGNPSGGFGFQKSNYTYIVLFDGLISVSELSRLHSSLGSGNTFDLITNTATTPIAFNGAIEDQNPSVDGEFRLDITSFFSGTKTPFSFSITPPIAGVSIENTSEVVIAQPITGTLPTDTLGIIVRGTDTDFNTADSNGFDVKWDLSVWGRTRTDIEAADKTGGANPPYLVGDFDVDDLPADRFRDVELIAPTSGTLTTTNLSTGDFSGAPDGSYFSSRERFKNNVSYGVANVNLVIGQAITGSLSTQLDDNTVSASGTVGQAITGSLSTQLDDNTVSASGTVGQAITGSLSTQLDDNTVSASGTVGQAITGSLSTQLDDNTVSASGTVGQAITGSLNVFSIDNLLSAVGTVGTISPGSNDISITSTFGLENINLSGDL